MSRFTTFCFIYGERFLFFCENIIFFSQFLSAQIYKFISHVILSFNKAYCFVFKFYSVCHLLFSFKRVIFTVFLFLKETEDTVTVRLDGLSPILRPSAIPCQMNKFYEHKKYTSNSFKYC